MSCTVVLIYHFFGFTNLFGFCFENTVNETEKFLFHYVVQAVLSVHFRLSGHARKS